MGKFSKMSFRVTVTMNNGSIVVSTFPGPQVLTYLAGMIAMVKGGSVHTVTITRIDQEPKP